MLPEFVVGGSEEDSEHDYVVRLHRPRFVARMQDAYERTGDRDWWWVAHEIERLVVVEWIDRPGDRSAELLRRAAVFVELETMDAFEKMEVV